MNLRITLDQWRALVAVVENGSHARAAEALHLSQSSVSYLLQKLESQLGVEVFRTEGRRSVLTPTGQLLYRRAHLLLDEAAATEKAASAISAGWEAEIGIAAEILFPQRILLDAMASFGEESPNTRIELIESVMRGTTEALLDGRADIAISPTVPQGMTGELLCQLSAVIAAHPSHPLHALGRPLTPRDLRAHRQLIIRETDATRSTKATLDTAQRWTVSSMSTSVLAARQGMGFAWYPVEAIAEELAAGTLKALPMREGGERVAPLYLVYADREQAGPGVLRLAQILHERTRNECQRIAASVARDAVARDVAATKQPRKSSRKRAA